MTNKAKILVFAGTLHKDSINKKLASVAAKNAESAGAEVTLIDLADYPLPLYDLDVEGAEGFSDNALKLKKLFRDADGFLIASPEHNSAYSAVLKNVIDWVSRSSGADDPGLVAFSGKFAGIMATSPGPMGGLRGLFALRELLQNVNVTVLSSMQAVGSGGQAFADDGSLKDEKQAKSIANIAGKLVETVQKLKA